MSVAMLNIFITLSALQDKFNLEAFFSQVSLTDTSQAAILSCQQHLKFTHTLKNGIFLLKQQRVNRRRRNTQNQPPSGSKVCRRAHPEVTQALP